MIDDPEMWALFRAEAEEHLQILDSGLLRLENDASDQATLETVFRSAHSLKGAARMMGALRVEGLAHGFEDALMGAAKGRNALEETTAERLYGELDALRESVEAAVNGNKNDNAPKTADDIPSAADDILVAADDILVAGDDILVAGDDILVAGDDILVAGDDFPKAGAGLPKAGDDFPKTGDDLPNSSTPILPNVMAPSAPALGRTYESNAPDAPGKAIEVSGAGGALAPWKIETMRVDTSRLDALLSMAGELVVSTKRAAGGKSEFEQMATLREEAQKLSLQQKRVLRLLEGELGAGSSVLRDLERLLDGLSARWEAVNAVTARLQNAHEDMVRLEGVVGELEEAIRGVRLLPLSTLFGLFPRSVRDLAKLQNKRVDFSIEGGETTADKRVIEGLKDPLMHMVRNAVDHGIEAPAARLQRGKDPVASLRLRGSQTATHIVIELEDDGRGLDIAAISASALRKGLVSPEELANMTPRQIEELIFAPGFSTAAQLTDVSGRGVGLDVVRDNVERLRGTIDVVSQVGRGCIFRLIVPLTLATTRVLLVRAADQMFAIPIENIASVRLLPRADCYPLRGRLSFSHGGEPVPTAHINGLLELSSEENIADEAQSPCVVLSAGGEQLGLRVDAVVEEQEIILKPLHSTLENLRHIAGATILGTGDVCLLLAPGALIDIASRQGQGPHGAAPVLAEKGVPSQPKALLLVEDSIVTRTQEKRILEGAGYTVTTAVDGADGWQKLANGQFDAVISDVEMPNLDGFGLTERIRQQDKYEELPVVLVTSLASEDDRRRGLQAGANAYITKGSFDQKVLLETLRMLI